MARAVAAARKERRAPKVRAGGRLSAPGQARPSAAEQSLTSLEWALWRLSAAFIRWQGDCLSAIVGSQLSGHDTALLHVIAYHDKAKGLSEIGRLLGRDDFANVQYAIRKLLTAGLIERVDGRSRKDTIYRASDAGLELIRRYRLLRRDLLVGPLEQGGEVDKAFGELATRLDDLTAFYETATRRTRLLS
jgi:predicted MarR family transcription regulator